MLAVRPRRWPSIQCVLMRAISRRVSFPAGCARRYASGRGRPIHRRCNMENQPVDASSDRETVGRSHGGSCAPAKSPRDPLHWAHPTRDRCHIPNLGPSPDSHQGDSWADDQTQPLLHVTVVCPAPSVRGLREPGHLHRPLALRYGVKYTHCTGQRQLPLAMNPRHSTGETHIFDSGARPDLLATMC